MKSYKKLKKFNEERLLPEGLLINFISSFILFLACFWKSSSLNCQHILLKAVGSAVLTVCNFLIAAAKMRKKEFSSEVE